MTPFRTGIVWNLGSFGVQGVFGVLLHALIGRYYGAAALGSFNQVFALYIFAAQFAVLGVHLAVGTHMAATDDREVQADVLWSGLGLALVGSMIVLALGTTATPLIARVFASTDVTVGWRWVLPAVGLFAVNKVLLAAVNGLRWMRLYAVAQAARFVLMVVALGACLAGGWPAAELPVVITAAEATVAAALLPALRGHLRMALRAGARAARRPWWRRQLLFGLRGLPSGALAELNTRVDVLMLGWLSSDAVVGIYSVASVVAEGVGQLAIVVRQNLNPILTRIHVDRRWDDIRPRLQRGIRQAYVALGLAGLVAVAVFPLYLRYFVGGEGFEGATLVFWILMGGFVLRSGYMPFNMVFVQAGRPGLQSLYIGGVIAVNAIGNLLMIPSLGASGAALATAFAFVVSVPMLRGLARRRLGVPL